MDKINRCTRCIIISEECIHTQLSWGCIIIDINVDWTGYFLWVTIILSPVHDCGTTGIVIPNFGSVNYSSNVTTFGSNAIFSCDEGFTLVGNSSRTCTNDGWSLANPTCGKIILYIHK